MGCTNCHASARDNSTFSSLDNVIGTPDSVVMFLDESPADIASQNVAPAEMPSFHETIANPVDPAGRLGAPTLWYRPDFLTAYP